VHARDIILIMIANKVKNLNDF